MTTIALVELLVSAVMAAAVIAYADGKARGRTVLGMAAVCVLVAYVFIFAPVVHAVTIEYPCYYESWWILLQPECW